MTIVIACNKKRLKKSRGSKNIVDDVQNKRKDIKVIKTFSVIDETFVNKMVIEVNPNKLLILGDVDIKSPKKYELHIEDILKELKEESNIEIIFAFGTMPKEQAKPMAKYLIEIGIYSFQWGLISSENLSELIKNGMSREEAIKSYERLFEEKLDGSSLKEIDSSEIDVKEESNKPTASKSDDEYTDFLKDYKKDLDIEKYDYLNEDHVKPAPETAIIDEWLSVEENAQTEETVSTEQVSDPKTDIIKDTLKIIKASCYNCGAPISAAAKFCEVCGSPTSLTCIECGEEISPIAKFCPSCGCAIKKTSAEESDKLGQDISEEDFDEEILDSIDETLLIEPIQEDEEENDYYEDSSEVFEAEERDIITEKSDKTSITDDDSFESHEKSEPSLVTHNTEIMLKKDEVVDAELDEDDCKNGNSHFWTDEDYERIGATKIIGCATIGVAQIKRRTGSTHISIEIANMLYKEGYDVGVCLLDDKEYENLKKYLMIDKDYHDYFSYNGLKYYRSNAYYFAQGEHQIMVNDCGILTENSVIANEYERMRVKIMLCDPSPWNMNIISDYIMNPVKHYHRTIYYLANIISKNRFTALFGQLEKEGFRCFPLAANDNVFEPSKENQEVYRQVLKSIIGEKKLTKRKRSNRLSLPFGKKD